jgi:hypothetical protein
MLCCRGGYNGKYRTAEVRQQKGVHPSVAIKAKKAGLEARRNVKSGQSYRLSGKYNNLGRSCFQYNRDGGSADFAGRLNVIALSHGKG